MKIKQGKITITSQIAYIAGFFDGEGCVRIKTASQGGNSYFIIAHITNTNLSILKYVQKFFGGQIRKQEKGVNKTIFNWYITSAEASDFLKTLSPFLQEKKAQAILAIKFHQNKSKLTKKAKIKLVAKISAMKKTNIYENPNLLTLKEQE